MKLCRMSEGWSQWILNLGTMWKWAVTFMLRPPLSQSKQLPVHDEWDPRRAPEINVSCFPAYRLVHYWVSWAINFEINHGAGLKVSKINAVGGTSLICPMEYSSIFHMPPPPCGYPLRTLISENDLRNKALLKCKEGKWLLVYVHAWPVL
jgi:hypothetical protein